MPLTIPLTPVKKVSEIIDTPQQKNFYATASLSHSIALKARAGTGKTHSLKKWAFLARGSGLATSFSSGTVRELGDKMPSKFPAQTMHALGRAAIKAKGKLKEMDSSKIFNLLSDHINDPPGQDIDRLLMGPIMKLVSLAKTFGIKPGKEDGIYPDYDFIWEDLAERFDIPASPALIRVARELLYASNDLALNKGIIDFDDMLYISLLWPHTFPKYGTILVDEVQDLNELQHLMLTRLLRPGGRIIGAGDDRQAIYAFRGALADSYSSLTRRFNMTEMPLTVSFRCSRAVVFEAQRFVPDIEPAPNAPEGKVLRPDSLRLSETPHTVLCRNNAPLITLALRLLVSGRTAEVAGRDIGKGLISLTKRISKRNLSSDKFIERLTKWANREIGRRPKSEPAVSDKKTALTAIALHHKDLKGIQSHLDSLYPDPKSPKYKPAEFHLSTIHKAKGKEWPKTLFLDPHLINPPWVEGELAIQQEKNVFYVGITRAMKNLTYTSSEDIL